MPSTMTHSNLRDRLAVCSWSLQPRDPAELLAQIQRIGIPRVQFALDPLRTQPGIWEPYAEQSAAQGVVTISGMVTTVGEDYGSMDSIRETGGVVPDGTWTENLANLKANAALASGLGLRLVTFHAGFLPEDTGSAEFRKLSDRLAALADLYGEQGLSLGLETGQETAEHLALFLEKLGRPNVGVNFDPANLILYDKGDPLQALRVLAPFLMQCHVKDATRTTTPGTWGEEVAVGSGQVDWTRFFQTLNEVNYQGDLAIEREAGQQRLEDILTARRHVESLPV